MVYGYSNQFQIAIKSTIIIDIAIEDAIIKCIVVDIMLANSWCLSSLHSLKPYYF